MIRLALLDDHPAVLAGLRRLIEHEPDLLIVGAAASATDLALQLGGQRADVLVLDHDLARSDGLAQCRRIKDRPNPPGTAAERRDHSLRAAFGNGNLGGDRVVLVQNAREHCRRECRRSHPCR